MVPLCNAAEAQYRGGIKNGLPHGKGENKWPNGTSQTVPTMGNGKTACEKGMAYSFGKV